jgi:uncharacterized phage-like protein YoqJ
LQKLIDNFFFRGDLTMILDDIKTPDKVTSNFHNRIVVATGHRPQKCGGFSEAARMQLKHIALEWLSAMKPRCAVSGMALGWDTAIVEACLHLGLPYVACIPFRGQESQWPSSSRMTYCDYLLKAANVIICSPGEYSAHKMQIRNERMIDMALQYGPGLNNSILLALWDGTSGGTENCILYARTRIQTLNAWPDFLVRSTLPA